MQQRDYGSMLIDYIYVEDLKFNTANISLLDRITSWDNLTRTVPNWGQFQLIHVYYNKNLKGSLDVLSQPTNDFFGNPVSRDQLQSQRSNHKELSLMEKALNRIWSWFRLGGKA